MKISDLKEKLRNGTYDKRLSYIYSCQSPSYYAERYIKAIEGFENCFGDDDIELFSAPGRTEIGGNHTDHQHGCVVAASVNLDIIAAAAINGTDTIRVQSEGYPLDIIDINNLDINKSEYDKSVSLIRGIVKCFTDLHYNVSGFDAYTVSNVLKGSGISSSAAFEVLIATIMNEFFANGELSPVEIAKICKYSENVYFGKPSGLLDQTASAVGSAMYIDFEDTDNPLVEKINLDLAKYNYGLCIIDSGADHADLTDDYAAIPYEMQTVAHFFGQEYLRNVKKEDFLKGLPELRRVIKNDRAALRAYHFFKENEIARMEAEALRCNDFERFLQLIRTSGQSSYMYLQNIYSFDNPKSQAVALTLALCDEFLGSTGAYRVHGGGFAGTVQAFVPIQMIDIFKEKIEKALGKDSCHVLSIRPAGGAKL